MKPQNIDNALQLLGTLKLMTVTRDAIKRANADPVPAALPQKDFPAPWSVKPPAPPAPQSQFVVSVSGCDAIGSVTMYASGQFGDVLDRIKSHAVGELDVEIQRIRKELESLGVDFSDEA